MLTIYKYPLQEEISETISLPRGAQILSAEMQNNHITIWALVDPDQPLKEYTFYIFGTGWDIPTVLGYIPVIDRTNFINTVKDGAFLIWHVFYQEEL